jgi:chromosome segregation ATPase
MPAPGSVDPVVGDRLDSLGRHVEVQGEQLARLESLAPAPATQAAYEELQPRLDELATRLEAGERRREAVAAEVARASQAWESQRAELRAELQDELAALARSAATRETAATGFDRVVAELAARVEAVERSELESAAGIARTVGTWESRLGEMEARLAEAAALGAEPVQDAATDGLLAEIAGRLDTLETDRDAGEMGRLRVLVDGVRMRLASSEKELAALAGSHEVVARLDELTWRLDSLENAGVGPASSLLPPVAGDGRFRVELRGLELRMEHAEAAARENREAVLTQLERLASRIEWRLQRLESANAGALSQPQAVEAPLGQVVPIRGEA